MIAICTDRNKISQDQRQQLYVHMSGNNPTSAPTATSKHPSSEIPSYEANTPLIESLRTTSQVRSAMGEPHTSGVGSTSTLALRLMLYLHPPSTLTATEKSNTSATSSLERRLRHVPDRRIEYIDILRRVGALVCGPGRNSQPTSTLGWRR